MALSDGLATQTTGFVTRPRDDGTFRRRLTGLIGTLLRTPVRSTFRPVHPDREYPYELDCLRGILADRTLDMAARRSREVGIGADQVLIRWGMISEDAYLDCLATHCGLTRENFEGVRRSDCPFDDDRIRYAGRHYILPIHKNGRLIYVHAPQNYAARRISKLTLKYRGSAGGLGLATRAEFDGFLVRHAGRVLARAAADGLRKRWPLLSASPSLRPRRKFWRMALQSMAIAFPFVLAPLTLIQIGGAILAIWFLLFTCLRLAGSFAPRPRRKRYRRLPDDQLPVYSVIVALYREAASVAPLMRSLEALDYPREKLDIKLVVEPDDVATHAAIAAMGPLPHMQIVTAPNYGPRTKPKALNYALTMVRGTFLAVFDAEDRPDPNQLREALNMFRDERVACAQASLCIDNTSDGWLPRMFTAEYAGQFDVFLLLSAHGCASARAG